MSGYGDTARGVLDALRPPVGALVTVAWQEVATYQPGAPDPVPIARSIQTYGVMVPYNRQRVGVQPDSQIRAGDRNLLLAAIDPAGAPLPEPPHGAVITAANGEIWKVEACEALCPTEDVVLFDITARR